MQNRGIAGLECRFSISRPPLPGPDIRKEGRPQGSPQYSIRATWVDRRAAELVSDGGSWAALDRVHIRPDLGVRPF